jgi:DNA-binding beta-propeller fold protein YncE
LFLGGLASPSGISVDRWDNVYFTQVPTPGVGGGANNVLVTDGVNIEEISGGEPEPSDVAVDRNGTAYWTCTTAGVILFKAPDRPPALLLSGLSSPKGIAIDHQGRRLYWTEVPTPGQPGSAGGMNRVSELDLRTGEIKLVDFGDPEPTDVAVAANGDLFWTCTSAGVVVQATQRGR